MKREILITLYCFIVFCLMRSVAVAATQQSEKTSEPEMTICTDPRPQVCTKDYTPVCAERKEGSHKTYSNGCNACSDHEVIGYKEGACKE